MKHRTEHKRAFSLMAVMSFMAIIGTFLAMLSFSSAQRASTAKRLTGKIKAKAMAEAGCEYGFVQLSENWDGRYQLADLDNLTPSSMSGVSIKTTGDEANDDEASYVVKIEPINDKAVLVTSTGTCGNVTDVSIISVQNLGGGSSDDGTILDEEAFSYAILCGGDLDFSGCGTISAPDGALFHANGTMNLKGTCDALIDLSSSVQINISNNVKVGGDVTAPAFSYKAKKVTIGGTKTQKSVTPVTIPDIDLTPYYNWALAHGEVYNSLPSGNLSPNGGIIWINGSAEVKNTINGSVIATGDISVLTGSGIVKPTANCAFAVVSRDGDIKMNGGEVNGLMYAKSGNLNYQGNGLIKGQVIVNGYIKNAGNSDIMAGYSQSIPSVPGGSTSTDNIVISAWQR